MNTDQTPVIPPAGLTKRQKRAERILNAAENLLLRHGYRRITMDDIASQSGIGKGTIYLHWQSKEALFGTLFLREVAGIWTELLAHLRADPQHVCFSQVMRTMMLIGMQRPLARAFITWDQELLGNLVESGGGSRHEIAQVMGQEFFLNRLRAQGLIRSDRNLALQSYALRAAVTGFLMTEPPQVGDHALSLEQRAEALAQTVRDAFEPAQLPPPEQLEQIAAEMGGWIEQLIAEFEARIRTLMK